MSGKFNEPRLVGNCKNCYYFTPTAVEGVCHRYPKPLNRKGMDYCGEFAWKHDASFVGEAVSGE